MKTIVDFPDRGVLTEEAAEWLIRLDGDSPPSRQELETLGQWLHRSPAHREELERLAELWDRMNVLTELVGHAERLQAWPAIRRVRAAWLRPAWVIAAVLGICGLGLPWLLRDDFSERALAADGLYATAVGQQAKTPLPDGSTILLNTNSQMRIEFGKRSREVYLLQGEALFTVAKDADRPFRVYAGGSRIQAVGTAFAVYVDGSDVQITVTEGRVSLASLESPGAWTATSADHQMVEMLGTLGAGQAATIRVSGHEPSSAAGPSRIQVLESAMPPDEIEKRLAWQKGVLMFSGDRLEDVVKEVSRYTTVAIEIPDATVRDMRIGGRFPVGETEVMLAALQANFNLKVVRPAHNQIVITGADE